MPMRAERTIRNSTPFGVNRTRTAPVAARGVEQRLPPGESALLLGALFALAASLASLLML